MNMTHGWLSIALACAFGALIGTLTALEISTRFEYGSHLWAIGALVGGITAYVAIDFRRFCAGVVHSYHRTIAWRPDSRWWKTLAVMSGGIVMMYSSIVGVGGVTVAYFSDNPMPVLICTLLFALFASVLGAGLGWLMTGTASRGAKDAADRERLLRNLAEIGWFFVCWCNPIGATLAAIHGLKWVAVHTPSAIARAVPATINSVRQIVNTLVQFVTDVFVYVHSQRRTICFVDATIGAAIGYTFGSAIIGTIAGALLGVLNYEIVSVRLLRLIPSSR